MDARRRFLDSRLQAYPAPNIHNAAQRGGPGSPAFSSRGGGEQSGKRFVVKFATRLSIATG
jgi:hypothetical protein